MNEPVMPVVPVVPVRPSDLHGRPEAGELLEALREWLERDVLTQTTGRLQFHARVAINLVAMVERELELGEAQRLAHGERLAALGVSDDIELAAAIRSGSFDDRYDEVKASLVAAVGDRLAVANPKYLKR